jgi:single-strand DNA-binding protein
MAGSLNRVFIIGRLGRDPELRYTQSNQPVASFSVATDENWTDRQTGEKKEQTEWHRITVWGKQAELCERYLSKGRLVFIEGGLRTREWKDKDGQPRKTTEIVAQRVQFLDRGVGAGAGAGRPAEPPPPGDSDAPGGGGFDQGFSDDDIPF